MMMTTMMWSMTTTATCTVKTARKTTVTRMKRAKGKKVRKHVRPWEHTQSRQNTYREGEHTYSRVTRTEQAQAVLYAQNANREIGIHREIKFAEKHT